MPAIITEDHFAQWLDPKESRPAQLLPLLGPYPVEKMESWAVSPRVNAAGVDDPDLLQPVADAPQPGWVQPSLFEVG